MSPELPAPLRFVAFAALFATTIPVCSSQAGSWSPSLRVAGGAASWAASYAEPFNQIGLSGHVVYGGTYVRAGLEGGWWEQLGHTGLASSTDNGVYAYQVRFTNYQMGTIVQVAPAGRRAPLYLVLGVADLVVVNKYDYVHAPTRSEWGHAPAVSGGVGIPARDGFGPVLEARWHWRRSDTNIAVPNHYFVLSAGVRF